MSLLQADSVEKVVRQPESERHLTKPLKLHDSSMACLTGCLKCFQSVALVGCCSCLLTGGFCDRLSVLSDLADRHYPVTFAQVFFCRCGLFLGEFPLRCTCFLGYCSVYFTPIACALNQVQSFCCP